MYFTIIRKPKIVFTSPSDWKWEKKAIKASSRLIILQYIYIYIVKQDNREYLFHNEFPCKNKKYTIFQHNNLLDDDEVTEITVGINKVNKIRVEVQKTN